MLYQTTVVAGLAAVAAAAGTPTPTPTPTPINGLDLLNSALNSILPAVLPHLPDGHRDIMRPMKPMHPTLPKFRPSYKGYRVHDAPSDEDIAAAPAGAAMGTGTGTGGVAAPTGAIKAPFAASNASVQDAAAHPAHVAGSAASAAHAAHQTLVTEVVTAYTTYCPGPTKITVGPGKTVHVTTAGWVTVTDCPCTIVKPCETGGRTVQPPKVLPTWVPDHGENGGHRHHGGKGDNGKWNCPGPDCGKGDNSNNWNCPGPNCNKGGKGDNNWNCPGPNCNKGGKGDENNWNCPGPNCNKGGKGDENNWNCPGPNCNKGNNGNSGCTGGNCVVTGGADSTYAGVAFAAVLAAALLAV